MNPSLFLVVLLCVLWTVGAQDSSDPARKPGIRLRITENGLKFGKFAFKVRTKERLKREFTQMKVSGERKPEILFSC